MADQAHQDHRRRVLLAVYDGYYAAALARSAVETARLAVRSAEAIEHQARRAWTAASRLKRICCEAVLCFSGKAAGDPGTGAIGKRDCAPESPDGNPLGGAIGETTPLTAAKIELPSEEMLLAEQKRLRPDYQNLLRELQQAEIAVRSRQKEFLPIVTGYSTWEADNPSLKDYGGNNWAAGITLRWNLFAGGGDAAQRDAALQRLEQKRRQLAAMESAMALEIRRAIIQYRTVEQQVKVAQAAEAQSEEGLRILRNRYDAGLATMTDLLSAEAARSNARTNMAEANYRHRLSYAQIEYAAGILSPTSTAVNLQ